LAQGEILERHGSRTGLRRRKVRQQGQPHKVRLLLLSDTPINDSQGQMRSNPYDPAFETYLRTRRNSHAGTFRALVHFAISGTSNTGSARSASYVITRYRWRLHYASLLCGVGLRVPKTGVLLHPECHDKFHRQNLSVSKPRLPERGVRRA